MRTIKGLVIFLALALVGIAASGCTDGRVSPGIPTPAVDPDKTIIARHAPYSLIRQYFPDRTQGDLYVGRITLIKLESSIPSTTPPVKQITLTFATGEEVLAGYVQAGYPLSTGCQALLFNKDSSGV